MALSQLMILSGDIWRIQIYLGEMVTKPGEVSPLPILPCAWQAPFSLKISMRKG
jgi:hypothetical protein